MSGILEEMFFVLPDMLCAVSVSGMLVEANPSFTRVLGHGREDLLSRQFIDFVHEDDRTSSHGAILSLVAGRGISGFKNRLRNASGGYVRVEWYAVMSSASGLIVAAGRPVCERGCCCSFGYSVTTQGEMPVTTESVKAVLRHARLVADETKRRCLGGSDEITETP